MLYQRANVAGGTFFFTVNLAERKRNLLVDHVNLLRAVAQKIKTTHWFQIDAMVILPDPLHCLWTFPDADNFSMAWQDRKMVYESADNELVFEVATPLGFHVRVTRAYWDLIVTIKHPVMAGRELEVRSTLMAPDEIRLSRSDPSVYMFYKSESMTRWVCAVTKRLNGDGFLITTYPTDTIKEGEHIWPK
jgi:hypothetical protein